MHFNLERQLVHSDIALHIVKFKKCYMTLVQLIIRNVTTVSTIGHLCGEIVERSLYRTTRVRFQASGEGNCFIITLSIYVTNVILFSGSFADIVINIAMILQHYMNQNNINLG